ncbi:MAG: ABC transporter substrate-binding protein [Candidatus Rokuibacteriota bacterium]|nr:MAG: ABC transporter substrate-binding protein [Candidatus Rokubacteria bacterium]PYO05268.1 MAG: ABC transporter substrate-binding protein [Candidatus Rokubacteria bacterium]
MTPSARARRNRLDKLSRPTQSLRTFIPREEVCARTRIQDNHADAPSRAQDVRAVVPRGTRVVSADRRGHGRGVILRALKPLVFVLAIVGVLAGAEAQRPDKIPRIGYLVISPLADPPSAERAAFLDGLKDLGYVAGRNIVIEYRSAAWNRELLPELATELVNLKVDVIVAVPGAVDAARAATKTIPIIVPSLTDPVEEGLVKSLARPGGNITGPGWSAEGLTGKRLELLKEAIPKLSRVAILWNPTNEGAKRQWQEAQSAARKLRMTLQSLEVRDPNDVPKAFAVMTQKHPDALITVASALTTAYRPIIIEFATKQRIPTMFALKADVEAGGLISYAPSLTDTFRRAARYVDRVLKGANPGDLPIEESTRFELVINLKMAKALGLTIPKTLLLQADQVIE